MDGLSFVTVAPPVESDPARADIACFIGFVARRSGDARDVPELIDAWDVFDALFAWDARPITAAGGRCDTALGAAVRSFFAQGGRKCYVVRLGDPWPVLAPANQRGVLESAFLPILPPLSAVDRSSWHGIGHLFGLPDVSFLCLPDLPDFFSVAPVGQVKIEPPLTPEIFVECATRVDTPAERTLRGIPAPVCDVAGFAAWADFVKRVGAFLARSVREVQFIAAIPLPANDTLKAQWTWPAKFGTAFVQLAYPWLRTRTSGVLPGGVEAPDGVLAGVLANGALTRGSWRSAIRQPVAGITAVEPVLDRAALARTLAPPDRREPLTVRDRVTVIGPAPDGFRLLSDVTTDADEAYRPANVNRLMNAIIRAARITGEPAVFQNSGPALWTRLRENLGDLLAGLWTDGALDGASADEAFDVRCDRSTMTQADLDAGRVICRVSFTAASPIVHITVVFAMDEGGQVSLAAPQSRAA